MERERTFAVGKCPVMAISGPSGQHVVVSALPLTADIDLECPLFANLRLVYPRKRTCLEAVGYFR